MLTSNTVTPNIAVKSWNKVKYFFLNRLRHSFIVRKHSKRWAVGMVYQLYPNEFKVGLQFGYIQLLCGWRSMRYRRRQARKLMASHIETLCKEFSGNRAYDRVSFELYDVIINGECCNRFNPVKAQLAQCRSQQFMRLARLLKVWSAAIGGWYIYDRDKQRFKYVNFTNLSLLSQQYAIEKLKEKGLYYA
jgi:hypothetical protein